jgi:hypothetical protein
MAIERLAFLADDLPQPLTDNRAVHVVVVSPALVAGVVRRIDVDALHLAGVVRQERFERNEVIALHDEISVTRLAAGEIGHVFEQVKRHLVVMIHHRLFPNPIQRRHINKEVLFAVEEYPFTRKKSRSLL